MQFLKYRYAILIGEILRSRLSYRWNPAPTWNFFFATCLMLLERKKISIPVFKGQHLLGSGEEINLSNIRQTHNNIVHLH